jgi:hypothetical protein
MGDVQIIVLVIEAMTEQSLDRPGILKSPAKYPSIRECCRAQGEEDAAPAPSIPPFTPSTLQARNAFVRLRSACKLDGTCPD